MSLNNHKARQSNHFFWFDRLAFIRYNLRAGCALPPYEREHTPVCQNVDTVNQGNYAPLSWAAMRELAATTSSDAATTRKAKERLVVWAIKPISAGPAKMPE